ncbi:MAG: HAMP domain-containing sensor histidine kinase [Bacteroidota bacterium]|nr:HAMP domain-containing histidine kinase [Candidatus Kapabacteria bacterium]MCS7303123.1 HAMP domain-containing histidine kinase [Candidatus Kapabacteria bacterium]MCX7936265.1 HAMP domain-containing histidine kinase [Chlorobiota bacterium]MDW8074454.1 HAMP domain-containing sensor histidine kinase [Bacteroidota bacterium]MDW8271070.1 HAMP domain-containing sensor histidine kinase [Bacteroidota bacterium]
MVTFVKGFTNRFRAISDTWSEYLTQLLWQKRWIINSILGIIAFAIVLGSLIYTQQLVASLVLREQRLVRFYADILQSFASANSIESLFLLDRVTPTIDFPCIITDSSGIPLKPYEQFTLNIDLARLGRNSQEHAAALRRLTIEMASEYPPVEVRDPNGRVVNYIYYTNSWVVKRLRILPYVEFTIVTLFVAVGYFALMMQRRRDESLIWVGMAKETAHQLGTPISSMLGWLELLEEHIRNVQSSHLETLGAIIEELQRDVERLRGIADRFSAIGSTPRLEHTPLCSLIDRTVAYMQRRLPRHGKTITIEWECREPTLHVHANPELLSWVLENLIKNAAEAIEHSNGLIRIRVASVERYRRRPQRLIRITVSDTGKGMTPRIRRRAFVPGYTTKERGWGLGLALSKRIIEEYHRGRLFIASTAVQQGTTIVIELPVEIDVEEKSD